TKATIEISVRTRVIGGSWWLAEYKVDLTLSMQSWSAIRYNPRGGTPAARHRASGSAAFLVPRLSRVRHAAAQSGNRRPDARAAPRLRMRNRRESGPARAVRPRIWLRSLGDRADDRP